MSAAVALLTSEQIAEIVAQAVAAALEERGPTDSRPALIDQATLARELGVSVRTIFALRAEGLPTIKIGDSLRFELAPCLEFLRSRNS